MVGLSAGALHNHPTLVGLLVGAIEKCQRASRGVHNSKGMKLSSLEMSIMSDAGITLSLACGNRHLLEVFGLQWTMPHLSLADLHQHGLPEAFVSFEHVQIIKVNMQLISGLLNLRTPRSPVDAIADEDGQAC